MAGRVKVKKSDPPNTETKEILAEAIVRLGAAVTKLNKSGLNKRAIVCLLHDATKLPKKEITLIIDAIPQLERWYCR